MQIVSLICAVFMLLFCREANALVVHQCGWETDYCGQYVGDEGTVNYRTNSEDPAHGGSYVLRHTFYGGAYNLPAAGYTMPENIMNAYDNVHMTWWMRYDGVWPSGAGGKQWAMLHNSQNLWVYGGFNNGTEPMYYLAYHLGNSTNPGRDCNTAPYELMCGVWSASHGHYHYQDPEAEQIALDRDVWHKWEVRLKYNTPTQDDGILQVLLDNAVIYNSTNFRWRNSNIKFNRFYVPSNTNDPGSDKRMYIDDFMVEVFGGWQDNNGIPVQPTNLGAKGSGNHADQCVRKIGRIGDVVIAATSNAGGTATSGVLHRSADGGVTWGMTPIQTVAYGSHNTILTGPGNMFHVFYIVNSGNTGIYLSSFLSSNTSPSAPTRIANVGVTSDDADHQHISATIDSTGRAYVVWHSNIANGSDWVYFISSTDNTLTSWNAPVALTSGTDGYIQPDIMADHLNNLWVVYTDLHDAVPARNNEKVYIRKSTDRGVTWTPQAVVDSGAVTGGPMGGNLNIIETALKNLMIFTQHWNQGSQGAVFSRSLDNGATWSAFSLIDHENSPFGYADLSSAIGDDGTIYVTSRNNKWADGSTISCSPSDTCWTNVINYSTNEGSTWTRAETNRVNTYRMYTSNSLRYQTWWNYGGRLEWTWHQGVDSSNQATYYDSNSNVIIYSMDPPVLTDVQYIGGGFTIRGGSVQ